MSVTIMLSPGMERRADEATSRHTSETNEEDEDIRNGIPKLSTLLQWKAGIEAQRRERRERREQAQRKSRVDKGKQVARVEVALETSAPVGVLHTAPSDPTDSLALHPPPEPSRLDQGEEQSSSQTRVFGLHLPLARLPETPTPAIPSQNPTPAIPPPTVESQSASSRISSVKIPYTKLERLRRIHFRSSRELKVREVPLSEVEETKLFEFSQFVGTPNQMTLFGTQFPQCHLSLVELELDDEDPKRYICIEGLKKREDIRHFHAVMSKKCHRKYYEPWKLCFHNVAVSNRATVASSPSNTVKMPGRYQIQLQKEALTLCGSLVSVSTYHGEQVSTVGGIIQVGSELFAMTTAHGFLSSKHFPSTPHTAQATTFQVDDYPDSVEEILVITEDRIPEMSNPIDVDWSRVNPVFAGYAVHQNQEDDWCLIPVPQEYQLPNARWSTSGAHFPSTLITKVLTTSPAGTQVYSATMNLGGNRERIGHVACAPSFLDGIHGTIKVWAVKMQPGYQIDLGKGDSGSWFVTLSGNEAVGTTIAKSPGKAFIAPLSHQFQSIQKSFESPNSPALPAPVPILLQAIHTSHRRGDSRASDQYMYLLIQLVQDRDFPHSVFTLTVNKALRSWEGANANSLKDLIKECGPDLERRLKNRPQRADQYLLPLGLVPTAMSLALIYESTEQELSHAPMLDNPRASPPRTEEVQNPQQTRRTPIAPRRNSFPRLRADSRTATYVLLSTWVVYLTGIGIGLWQLIVSDLSPGVKAGGGVVMVGPSALLGGLLGLWVRRYRSLRARH